MFYATDDQNAENKFIRLVKKRANNNVFVDVDKYTIRRYPDARGHDSYTLVSRRPENVKSKNIVILNEPSDERKKKDGRGWYVLYDQQKVIAQSNFASRQDAITEFGDGDIRGPFNSGVEIKRQKSKKETDQQSLFEQINILIEREINQNELTKEQIKFLDDAVIGTWKYNNGLIDVNGQVSFTHGNHTSIPVKFGYVSGYFFCCVNKITSLKNCPYQVHGDFRIWDNKLTSLEYMPTQIDGKIQMNENPFILNDKLFEDLARVGGRKKIDGLMTFTELREQIPIQFGITDETIIEEIWKSYMKILDGKSE